MDMIKIAALTLSLLSVSLKAAPIYNETQSYQQGSQVEHLGSIYQAKWWADTGDIPGAPVQQEWQTPWKLLEQTTPPTEPLPKPEPPTTPEVPAKPQENRIGPEVTYSEIENLSYYLIDPDTPDDIAYALSQDDTVPMHGRTDYNVAWKYTYAKKEGICSIAKAEVKVTTHYVMPKLTLRSSANIDTQAKFNAYYDKLMAHEKNHHGFGVSAAQEIEQLIFGWEPESCQTIGNSINSAAYNILDKYGEQNRIYDDETNHGYTEGVVIH
ncbi:DUF922 domain-containing protein [Vibrio sp. TBV020]|uniref:DUF922 domain-containing protein n=1 Tax=Vibrio sp. TBV020 TaxID=3137398 RepID=UPI0038CD6A7B